MDTLSEERLNRHGLLNIKEVKGVMKNYHSGDRAYAGKVWNLMMFQVWWDRYLG